MLKPIKANITLYLILLVAVLVCMYFLKDCSRGASSAIENDADSIDVCIEYAPLSYYVYDDTLGGFQYDIINYIARQKNLKLKFHPAVTLEKSLEELKNGNYDILIAQFPVTSQAKEDFIFTDDIYLDRQILVQRQDSLGNIEIKSQLDLAGDTVHVVKNSAMEQRIETLSEEIGDTIYVYQEAEYGSEQLILMVSSGLIKYAVVNEKIAKAMSKDLDNINIGTKISFTQFQSWTLPKSQTVLRDSINSWLKELKQSDTYKQLSDRYFK